MAFMFLHCSVSYKIHSFLFHLLSTCMHTSIDYMYKQMWCWCGIISKIAGYAEKSLKISRSACCHVKLDLWPWHLWHCTMEQIGKSWQMPFKVQVGTKKQADYRKWIPQGTIKMFLSNLGVQSVVFVECLRVMDTSELRFCLSKPTVYFWQQFSGWSTLRWSF